MYFFTADQHYGHKNIIEYCNRPFDSVEEMDAEIMRRHNEVVAPEDVVIHVGDLSLVRQKDVVFKKYVANLNGNHIFIRGSHDHWMNSKYHERWEKRIEGVYIVADHYAGRVWSRSHYGSWLVYAHSHGKLAPIGKSHDVGVDNNNFYPVSFDQLCKIMETKEDNPNLIRKN